MPFDPAQVFAQRQQMPNQNANSFASLGRGTQNPYNYHEGNTTTGVGSTAPVSQAPTNPTTQWGIQTQVPTQPQKSGPLNGFFRMNNAPGTNSQEGDAIHAISQGEHYLDPAFAAGTLALPHYMRTLSSLTRHPTQLEDQIMGSYTASPYAQYQEQNLQQTANQAAGAGGQIGTPDEQIALDKQEQGIVSKDQQQYYNDAMKPFEMGLSGEQYLTGMGLRAGQGISQDQNQIAHTYMSQEAIDNAKQALQDKENSSTFSSILGGVVDLAGNLIPGAL